MTEPKYHHSAIDRLPVVETDTPPSAEQIIEDVTENVDLTNAIAKALTDAGKIIVDKDELQDICNAIAVGDQASAWEKLTSMTRTPDHERPNAQRRADH